MRKYIRRFSSPRIYSIAAGSGVVDEKQSPNTGAKVQTLSLPMEEVSKHGILTVC